ncbi:PREDICTED: LINE-1 type transposase domain-containing protein 1 [Nanorana parkeri]|uniref:LINE-1 type transposase domain-containing protein 1 n=1 Tax=Nanorana parkeri TaxID=125878 RepID=UPI000854B79D|nr:PREDICTED: LINE-1 type transposase domain-containing protein 1 [Nanorana parkeri]
MSKKKDGRGLTIQDGGGGGGSHPALPTPSKQTGDRNRDAAVRLERFTRHPDTPAKARRLSYSADRAYKRDMGPGSPHISASDSEDPDDTAVTVSTVPKTLKGPKASKTKSKPIEPTISDVFSAVQLCNAALTSLTDQVQGMRADISFMRHDLQKVRDRTSALEGRVSGLEDTTTPLLSDVKTALHDISAHTLKMDDVENRLRRNNIRAVGIPERTEGANATDYMESWLCEVFGKTYLSPLFAVERAHRVPSRPLPPGNPPRPMLIRLLNYRDKERILRKARDMGEISLAGSKIMLFPDFSQEVQRRRAKFMDVKKRLQHLHLSYSMIYPARLRVIAAGETHFFDNLSQASSWLDKFDRWAVEDHRSQSFQY